MACFRDYEADRLHLLTPHPSSSTQYPPSSPVHGHDKVWPSLQYARPNLQGDWYSIGRKSTSNNLALPSSNRLVSRVHVRIRYLADCDTFEIDCLGFNGIYVHLGQEKKRYVKKSTLIKVQIAEEDTLVLDVAGSNVTIVQPQNSRAIVQDALAPSSPVMFCSDADLHDPMNIAKESKLVLARFEPLSPLHSATGMVTPSVTPSSKRVRYNETSPAQLEGLAIGSTKDSEERTSCSVLRPRLINFQSKVSTYACKQLTSFGSGKENIPPDVFDTVYMRDSSPVSSIDSSLDRKGSSAALHTLQTAMGSNLRDSSTFTPIPKPASSPSEDKFVPSSEIPKQFAASVMKSPEIVQPGDMVEESIISHFADVTPVQVAENTDNQLVTEAVKAQAVVEQITEDEISIDAEELDPDFIDLLLNVLAGAGDATPTSSLVPFFPVDTKMTTIEAILRTQESVVEHIASSKGVTTWSYEPSMDTDTDRVRRLTFLQKPQRSLRKRTYQQLHTYEYEHAKYVMDCEAAGIKPVRFDGTRYRRTRNSDA